MKVTYLTYQMLTSLKSGINALVLSPPPFPQNMCT